MTRRLIRKADAERVTEIVLNCAAVDGDPWFYWDGDRLRLIEVPADCGLSAVEIVRLGERGIHPGADGWEIEEAPANARPPLPPGSGWFTRGIDSYSLDGPNGTIAKAHHDGRSWTWSIAPRHVRTTARDLWEAQERAEDACRAAGLFDAPTVDRAQAIRDALIERLSGSPLPSMSNLLNLLNGSDGRVFATSDEIKAALVSIGAEPDGNRWRLSDGPPPGWAWNVGALVTSLKSSPVDCSSRVIATVGREDDEPGRRAAALMACRRAGLFAMVEQAPTAPDLGTKVDAIHDAAGAPPTGAALVLRQLAMRLRPGEDVHVVDRLCGAFVAELRASLPAPPMPAPRTTDGALTAYLLEHHREAWRPGEDALALAIRLLGDLNDTIADTREEARVADENAKELEAELGKVRAALAREEARRIEAERGRGEALGDLATVRADVLKSAHELAAKMGAPHG